MVVVLSSQAVNVHRNTAMNSKAVKYMRHHFHAQITHFLPLCIQIHNAVRSI